MISKIDTEKNVFFSMKSGKRFYEVSAKEKVVFAAKLRLFTCFSLSLLFFGFDVLVVASDVGYGVAATKIIKIQVHDQINKKE